MRKTEDESIELHRFPDVVERYIEVLTPLVERLHADHAIYVDVIDAAQHMTERGRAAIRPAHEVALEAFTELHASVGRSAEPTAHHRLLCRLSDDASHVFGVIAAALEGMADSPEPCAVAWGLSDLLSELEKNFDRPEVEAAVNFVAKNPAHTPAEIHALFEAEQQAKPVTEAGLSFAAALDKVLLLLGAVADRYDAQEVSPRERAFLNGPVRDAVIEATESACAVEDIEKIRGVLDVLYLAGFMVESESLERMDVGLLCTLFRVLEGQASRVVA